jgi:hypothetical protein
MGPGTKVQTLGLTTELLAGRRTFLTSQPEFATLYTISCCKCALPSHRTGSEVPHQPSRRSCSATLEIATFAWTHLPILELAPITSSPPEDIVAVVSQEDYRRFVATDPDRLDVRLDDGAMSPGVAKAGVKGQRNS